MHNIKDIYTYSLSAKIFHFTHFQEKYEMVHISLNRL